MVLNVFIISCCLICGLRYGGLSFGQQSRVVRGNSSQMKEMLERMVSALQVDPQLFKNVTSVSIGQLVEDFSNVLGRLVTSKNAKVSCFCFFKNLLLNILIYF